MKLTEIKPGEWVVLDANIIVYANQQQSAECVQLLRRCALREVRAVVPLPTLAEVMHTLMLIEARENGWIGRANPSRALAEHPELVRRLSRYATQMREFLGIGLRLESALPGDLLEAMSIQREYGLLTNDALLLAVAHRLNCAAIASADKAFSDLRGMLLYEPGDVGN
jgi:predicted nucleic acid-binding protein